MKRISVQPAPRQSFSFAADGDLSILLDWNTVAGAWFFDLDYNGTPIVRGRKIVLNINLLDGIENGALLCLDSSANDLAPTLDSLPDGDARLYYYTREEILAL